MEGLAPRRSRRSTAGNRMEAALAEMALDETSKDLDDDNDFVNEKDEEDAFESDFASTDEEVDREDGDAGETAIYDEERSARKAERARLDKRTAAAHAKHRATFHPQATAPPVIKPKPRPKSIEMMDIPEHNTPDVPQAPGQKRKSQRRHTVLNTNATDSRVRETEEKKAAAPKKYKPTVRSFTQAELIQRALDNEEGNIKEHKNYLKVEEEKRKKARAIKMPAVEGPLIRWISKVEDEKFKVQVEVAPPQTQTTAAPTYAGYTTAQLNVYYAQLYQYLASQTSALPATTQTTQSASGQTSTSQLATVSSTSPTTSTSTTPAASTPASQAPSAAFSTFRLPNTPYPYTYYTSAATSSSSTPSPSIFTPSLFKPTAAPQPPQKQYTEEERTEKVAKNYVVIEAGQREGIMKPPWKDMMKAMFGDHVKWEELKALSGKGRPLSRVKQMCPISGEVAPYLDPRTGVPFADVEAYKILTSLLGHEYIWSPELRCYVGRDQAR